MDVKVEKEKLRKKPNVCFEKLGGGRNLLLRLELGEESTVIVGGGGKALAAWSPRGLWDIEVGCLVGSLELRREARWSLGPLVYG